MLADSDNPAWIAEQLPDPEPGIWDETWTRHVVTPIGDLGVIQHSDGTTAVQLANLHGDITAPMPNTTGADWLNTYTEHTECGQPRTTSGEPARYGWFGAKQRSADKLGGLILMGVRLHNPPPAASSPSTPSPAETTTPTPTHPTPSTNTTSTAKLGSYLPSRAASASAET
ncbi:hypothetical protein [Phytoactinopolyspora limicola]|uniref:hypothetical protein n=1 Tax=Phytoactinopolyspora limicola TaxID=2715536 RepID=UPI00140BEE3F|nr:hypothetical protein [Phytoactinopolyspora limicola]